jgi:hypothetical protein
MGMSMKARDTGTRDLFAILLLFGASSLAGAAQAQPVTGLYIGGGAGVNFQ